MVLHSVLLAAVSLQPAVLLRNPELRQKCHDLLVKLHEFLHADTGSIRALAREDPGLFCDGVPFEIVPASVVLCKSLATLLTAGALPLPLESDGSADLTAISFVDNALDVLEDVSEDTGQFLRHAHASLGTPPGVTTTSATIDAGSHGIGLPTADASGINTGREGQEALDGRY